jgi:hypothetical protein
MDGKVYAKDAEEIYLKGLKRRRFLELTGAGAVIHGAPLATIGAPNSTLRSSLLADSYSTKSSDTDRG